MLKMIVDRMTEDMACSFLGKPTEPVQLLLSSMVLKAIFLTAQLVLATINWHCPLTFTRRHQQSCSCSN